MEGQISAADKKRRAAEMSKTAQELKNAFISSMEGKIFPVLFEERNTNGQVGYTPNYISVTVSEPEDLRGKIKNVLITGREDSGDSCTGIIVK